MAMPKATRKKTISSSWPPIIVSDLGWATDWIWNKLPEDVVSAETLNAFKSRLDDWKARALVVYIAVRPLRKKLH